MKTRRPNFLFLFPDQHRPDWLGSNPHLPLRTPHLDRLANAGILFTRAFTPSPVCSPARACLATGHGYPRCGVRSNGQNTPLSMPTYYRHLRNEGYEVVGVGKFDLHKPDLDWGLDGSQLLEEYGFTAGIDNEGKGDAIVAYQRNGMSPKGPYMQFLQERGLARKHFDMYAPYLGKPGWLDFPAVTELPDDAYCDNWVASNGERFLRDFPRDQPWHLVVNFVGPHGPFDVTASMRARWENVELPPPFHGEDLDPRITLLRRQNYAAMIENIDSHVGRLVDLVARRGELEHTIIVYASDHGEMLGDHGRWGKTVWHTPSSGIPLIVSGPGIPRGARSDALVSLHDLGATFLDYAGAAPLPAMDARSFRAVLEARTPRHRDHVLSALGKWTMVCDGRHKLVIGASPLPMLYDLEADPLETTNRAQDLPGTVTRLAEILHAEGAISGPNATGGA